MLDVKIIKIHIGVKMRKIFTSIVNSKILVKIYKNSENKHYTNTIFKAKKTLEH